MNIDAKNPQQNTSNLNQPRWLGHGGESLRPFPASVLAFLLPKSSGSFVIAEATSVKGGTRSVPAGSSTLSVGVALMLWQAPDS